jgi:hypothetical protein
MKKMTENGNKKSQQGKLICDLYILLTCSMKQSPCEAKRFSASQEIPCILWNPTFYYHIYKCPQTKDQSRPQANVSVAWRDHLLGWGFVTNSPTLQAGGLPPVSCPRLFIPYICSYLPYWKRFLHPQPDDGAYPVDRNPLITDNLYILPEITSWRDSFI